MDCSPPGSSVHGDSPGKNTGVGCHVLLQGIFPTQGATREAQIRTILKFFSMKDYKPKTQEFLLNVEYILEYIWLIING